MSGSTAQPGLLRGLADDRVVAALRLMHGDVERSWTATDLAREVGMSRSAFFERFSRTVGVTPMDYLLTWRMALAKSLFAPARLRLMKWPAGSAIARPARSARPSADTSACRRAASCATRPSRTIRKQHLRHDKGPTLEPSKEESASDILLQQARTTAIGKLHCAALTKSTVRNGPCAPAVFVTQDPPS